MKDGGPAFEIIYCRKAGCIELAVRKQGHQPLCAKHYRYGQMKVNAKRKGKLVPTDYQLDNLTPNGLLCRDCKTQMNWLGKDGQRTVVTLQHYRDGTMAFVCRSCNTRHAYMPGDTFREMPKDHKYCPHCKTARPFDAFALDSHRSGEMKLKSWCKQCSSEAHREWRERQTA